MSETNSVWRTKIDEVKNRVDIREIIAKRVQLNTSNMGRCPFHEDEHPSLSVNIEGRYFHCFGCGVGGDVFTFLNLIDGSPFLTALAELAAATGVDLGEPSPEDKATVRSERGVEEIRAASVEFYVESMTKEVRRYLKQRGVGKEAIRRFRLGWAGGGLKEFLTEERGFKISACVKAGVLKRSQDSDEIRDYFYKRVIIPTIWRGTVAGITGRRLDDSKPTYVKLKGPTSRLWNEEALARDRTFIVEGPFDGIALAQGDLPVVALIGTAIPKELLPRFDRSREVIICLDPDEAGREGTVKLCQHFADRARVIDLPDGLDPDEFLRKHGAEEFEALASSAPDGLAWQVSLIPEATAKTRLNDQLLPVLQQLAKLDAPKAEAYLKEVIKPRFGLAKTDLDAYRSKIRALVKSRTAPEKALAESEADVMYSAHFDGLVDLVSEGDRVAFLIKNGNVMEVVHSVQRDGATLIPPPRESIPFLLPRGKEVLSILKHSKGRPDSVLDLELFESVLAFHDNVSELPAGVLPLITAWDFHTYQMEHFNYSPMLCWFAVPERGKSRTGRASMSLAYRGLTVESLREAYLLRVAHDLRVSLFIDVQDLMKKAERNGVEDILLNRYERGARVGRVLYPDRGPHRDTVYYEVFGPTVIGVNEPLKPAGDQGADIQHARLGKAVPQRCAPRGRTGAERAACGLSRSPSQRSSAECGETGSGSAWRHRPAPAPDHPAR